MLIVIYARVSTEEQARTGFSLGEQLKACRERAHALALQQGAGAPPPEIQAFTDDASGEWLERPGLQAALDLVRQQKVHSFVCLDPDRLARRLMHQLLVTDEIERTGCRLEFVQHDYQETPEGRLFYQMRGAIAEFEKAKILERTARGQRGKIANGGLPHSIRMYGYRFIKGAPKQAPAREVLVPEPREAEIVRQIYRWHADEALTAAEIARRLNDLGIPTKTQRGLWRAMQVDRILRHPVYTTGVLALRKQDHRGLGVARRLSREQRQRQGLSLTPSPRPAAEWLTVTVEPLVAEAKPTPAKARRSRQSGLLTGLGRCGVCGAALHYLGAGKLACSARWTAGSTCTLPTKARQAVEEVVWQALVAELTRPAVLGAALQEPQVPQPEAAVLEAERRRREAEQERVGLLYARGLWPAEKALTELERLQSQIVQLEARLQTVVMQTADTPSPAVTPELQVEALQLLMTLPLERKAELIRLAIAGFTLHPTGRGAPPRVTVEFR